MLASTPKKSSVSIIIPCYNAEEWIAEAIQSALDQDWPDCEVIVIDDGSHDESLKIIESFGDQIRYETGPNKGGCAARNRGVELAKGEWIQFLDADDLLTPVCVSSKMDFVEKNSSLISQNIRPVSRVRSENEVENAYCAQSWYLKSFNTNTILEQGAPSTPAPLLKKSDLIAVGGFRVGLESSQEFDLFLRMSIDDGICFESVKETGVVIRVNPHSVSRSGISRTCYTKLEVLERVSARIGDENAIKFESFKKSFGLAYFRLARIFARGGERNLFLMCRAKALEFESSTLAWSYDLLWNHAVRPKSHGGYLADRAQSLITGSLKNIIILCVGDKKCRHLVFKINSFRRNQI